MEDAIFGISSGSPSFDFIEQIGIAPLTDCNSIFLETGIQLYASIWRKIWFKIWFIIEIVRSILKLAVSFDTIPLTISLYLNRKGIMTEDKWVRNSCKNMIQSEWSFDASGMYIVLIKSIHSVLEIEDNWLTVLLVLWIIRSQQITDHGCRWSIPDIQEKKMTCRRNCSLHHGDENRRGGQGFGLTGRIIRRQRFHIPDVQV